MYTRIKNLCRIFLRSSRLSLMESLTIKTVLSPYLSIYISSVCLLLIYYLFGVDPAFSVCCTSRRPCIRFHTWLSPLPLSEPWIKHSCPRTQLGAQYSQATSFASGSLNGPAAGSNKKHRTFLLVTISMSKVNISLIFAEISQKPKSEQVVPVE